MQRSYKPAALVLPFLLAVLFSCGSGQGSLETQIHEARQQAREAGVPGHVDGFFVPAVTRSVDFDTPIVYFARAASDISRGQDNLSTEEHARIVDYGPVGRLPASIRRPQIYVVFEEPVIPVQAASAGMVPDGLLQIEPPVSGRLRALGSRMFVFEPEHELVGQHEYRVTVHSPGASGRAVHGFSFRDDELSLLRVHAGSAMQRYWGNDLDIPPEEARVFTLEFNYPVAPDALREYVSVLRSGTSTGFALRRAELPSWMPQARASHYLELELAETPAVETDIRVGLVAGARSTADSTVGSSEARFFDFSTVQPFHFLGVSTTSYRFPGGWEDEPGTLYLEFSHDLDPDSVDSRVLLQSDDWIDVSGFAHVSGPVIRLRNLPTGFEQRVAIELREGISDRFSRILSETLRVSAELPPATGRFSMPDTGQRIVESAFPARIRFSYRNLERAAFAIGSLDDPFFPSAEPDYGPLDMSHSEPNVPRLEVMDLYPYLNRHGTGSVEVRWNVVPRPEEGRRPFTRSGWLRVQSTDIGLVTRYARNRVLVWAQSMTSGDPVGNAAVTVAGPGGTQVAAARTGPDGFAAIPLNPDTFDTDFSRNGSFELYVSVGDSQDRLTVSRPQSHSAYRSGIGMVRPVYGGFRTGPDVWMATDRGIYRPGETVSVAGFDRVRSENRFVAYNGPYEVAVRHLWGMGPDVFSDSGTTDTDGFFRYEVDLPRDLEPGRYRFEYTREDRTAYVEFRVAFFQPADMSVAVLVAPDPVLAGDTLTVRTDATYLGGGVPRDAEAQITVTAEPYMFSPVSFSRLGYRFGPEEWTSSYSPGVFQDVLDATGSSTIQVDTHEPPQEGRAYRYTVQSAVVDLSDRETVGRSAVVVHPAAVYAGLRLEHDSWFFGSGDTVSGTVQIVRPQDSRPESDAVDADNSYSGEIGLALYFHEWQMQTHAGPAGAFWRTYERVTEEESVVQLRIRGGRGEFSVEPRRTGSYTLAVRAPDSEGRVAVTELGFFVTGADMSAWAFDYEGQIRLDPEHELYSPGETARILVRSPLPAGRYLVTVEQSGILDEFFVDLDGSLSTIDVPVREAYAPVVYVGVFGTAPRSAQPPVDPADPDLGRPTGLYGMTALPVSTDHHRLDVDVSGPDRSVRPGDTIDLEVQASQGGVPVEGARVVMIGADRGVTDLIDHRIPDPVTHMYRPPMFPLEVEGGDSRHLLLSPVLFEARNLHGGGGGGKAESDAARFSAQDFFERADFSRLAVFDTDRHTDSDGTVRFRVTMPDSLTTWRFTAVAIGAERFGIGETELQTALPVNIRNDFPRLLRIRDSAELGVLLTNTTDRLISGRITLETQLPIHGPRTVTVDLEPGESTRVPFTAAAVASGAYRIETLFESDVFTDRAIASLRVVEAVITETVSTTALVSTDTTVVDRVLFPIMSLPGSERLTVTLLTDRLTAVRNAREVFAAPDSGLTEHLVGRALAGIDRAGEGGRDDLAQAFETMTQHQQPDGGIRSHSALTVSNAAVSARVGIMLADLLTADPARVAPVRDESGFDVELFTRYLRDTVYQEAMPMVTRLTAAYALVLLGVFDADDISRIEQQMPERVGHAERSLLGLAFFSLGDHERGAQLYHTMKDFVLVSERSVELRDEHPFPRYVDSGLSSLVRMSVLADQVEPQSVFGGRIAETIELRRTGNLSVVEAFWVLHARLRREQDSAQVSAQTVSVFIGDNQIGSGGIGGRYGRQLELHSDSDSIEDAGPGVVLPLILQGVESPLWYRLQFSYELPSEVLTAWDQGMSVVQSYANVHGDTVDPEDLVSGRTYLVRTTISTGVRRSMVRLAVPIPSGMDIIDTSLETTVGAETGSAHSGIILDNEWHAMFPDLRPGAIEVEFLARATTPGVFPTPPANAVLLYEPEVFGRSEGVLVQIRANE